MEKMQHSVLQSQNELTLKDQFLTVHKQSATESNQLLQQHVVKLQEMLDQKGQLNNELDGQNAQL